MPVSSNAGLSTEVNIPSVLNKKPDQKVFTQNELDQCYDFAVRYRNTSISREELIAELRGGAIQDWVSALGLILAIITVINNVNVDAFQAATLPHLSWLGENPRRNDHHFQDQKNTGPRTITTSLEFQKPSDIPQMEYSSLSRSQKKQLRHPLDGYIEKPNYPKLRVGFYQTESKTPKHGEIHNLPVNENGKASKDDALMLRDSLVEMGNSDQTEWYRNGGYQLYPGTNIPQKNTINLYDRKRNILAVFQEIPNQEHNILTTLEMTVREIEHFDADATKGHFVSESVLNKQTALTRFPNNNNNQ